MQAQRGSTAGLLQPTGTNAAGIQSNGPYRKRKRVLTITLRSAPAAEHALDNTMLRWHGEQISRWDKDLQERSMHKLIPHQALPQIVIF